MENWALVTGASSGIGRETAIVLSDRYNVVLGGRDALRLKETQEQCNPESKSVIWEFDVSDLENLAKSLSDCLKSNRIAIEAFVHCAGVSRLLPLKATGLPDMRDTFGVNIFAPFICIQALTSRRVNGGALRGVVCISSNLSPRGSKAFSIYGASKGAVDAMVRSLAVELAPRVRINSVLPGAVRTRMTETVFSDEDVISRMKSRYPLGLGSPRDIANAVDFLLSEKARWITGQQLTVDGGANINITG